jgi:hypothetical protein
MLMRREWRSWPSHDLEEGSVISDQEKGGNVP